LASRFSRKRELRRYKKQLEHVGFAVTSRWLNGSSKEDASTAERDVADIQKADAVILFAEAPRTATRCGRMVEFGIGIALQKILIVIGGHENIFTHLDDVQHFADWKECFQALTRVSLRHVWSGPSVTATNQEQTI
jgi:nucleoside 2-deoxyribosyltransferase